MTKEIQRLKKRLVREEMRRQGKRPSYQRWLLLTLLVAGLAGSAWLWYHVNQPVLFEKRLQTALNRKANGESQRALDELQRLTADAGRFGQRPRVLYETADLLEVSLGRYDEALLTWLLLMRDEPEKAREMGVLPRVATLYKYRLNDCEQAIAVYQQLLDQPDESTARWQYEVADCYFRLNNFEQARIEFESLQKKNPESDLLPEVRYRIAVTYALENMLPEAAASYRLVDETWPEHPYALEARFGLAAVLEEQERLLEALEILEALVGMYPNAESLALRIEQLKARIDKKKRAI
ncbi:MAG: tetratricopeptide repeat protein [Desulfuromonadales bacterium]|nr:tetratricopeptide repeat protein [Desulfuromonadales bacterium]